MLKEGVSVRTSDHDYALTAMTVVSRHATLLRMHYQRLIQLLGRVCGTGHLMPVLYIPSSLNDRHMEAYRLEANLTRCVEDGGEQGLCPRDAIIQGDTGFADLRNNAPLIRRSAQPEDAIQWIRVNSQRSGYEILPTRRNPRTPENILTGPYGYHRLVREMSYQPVEGIPESRFFQIARVAGLQSLNPSTCGISADRSRGQRGGLLWQLGENNQQLPLVQDGEGNRHYPIVRYQSDDHPGTLMYRLSPFMRQVAERLRDEFRLPIREGRLQSLASGSVLGVRQRDDEDNQGSGTVDYTQTCAICTMERPLLPCPNTVCTFHLCQICLETNRNVYNRHTCPACTLPR
jgi:hypothetical protein